MCHEVWVFHHEWTTNYKNYSKLEREHATQSFYSSVILHATLQPEDECPAQRLDYDRTNLLQNHKPKAVFFDFIFLIKSSRCMLVEYWKTYPKIFPLCRKPMYSVFYSVHIIRLKKWTMKMFLFEISDVKTYALLRSRKHRRITVNHAFRQAIMRTERTWFMSHFSSNTMLIVLRESFKIVLTWNS